MISVKIKQRIYIRKGPGRSFDVLGVATPGANIINMDDKVPGESYKGINDWYYLTNEKGQKQYYWGGGVTEETSNLTPSGDIRVISTFYRNYNSEFIGIPNDWRQTEGKNVNVAVLDSGCTEIHPDLVSNFLENPFQSVDFTNSGIGIKDNVGHGTHVIGLVGARSTKSVGVVGIAPQCRIQNLKVILDSGDALGANLSSALKHIKKQRDAGLNINIVNLSFGISVPEYFQLAEEIQAASTNSIIIAAAGENKKLLASNGPWCPAFSPNVISVGTVDQDFINSNPNPTFHDRVDFILPSSSLLSTYNDSNLYKTDYGSSMATALVSGLVALIISKNGGQSIELSKIKSELSSISIKYSKDIHNSSLSIIKIK